MSLADRYRRNACECIAVTSFFADPRQRVTALALAEAWSRLAEQAEKNEHIDPLRGTDPPTQPRGPDEP